MPAKPQWFLRVPQMIEALESMRTPVVDRASVEPAPTGKRETGTGSASPGEHSTLRKGVVPMDAQVLFFLSYLTVLFTCCWAG